MTRAARIAVFGLVAPSVVLGALMCAHAVAAPPALQNVTPSLPLGIYRRLDAPVRMGGIVAIRQPALAASYLRGLGFPPGAFLLKRVAAVAGARVCTAPNTVTVGDQVLLRQAQDRFGMRLPTWTGCRALATDELFLEGDGPRSFDSRYFGPITRGDVVGVYERLP